MKCCPHCGQPLPELRAGRRLPPLKARLYDVVQRAGPDGIPSDGLGLVLYGAECRKTQNRIKAHVAQINTILAGTGVRVSAASGRYRLIKPTARAAA